MKRLLALFACSLCLISNLQAQTGDSATPQPAANEQQPVANRYHGTGVSDKERYRRSSLCIIMLTHRGKKYAEEMGTNARQYVVENYDQRIIRKYMLDVLNDVCKA